MQLCVKEVTKINREAARPSAVTIQSEEVSVKSPCCLTLKQRNGGVALTSSPEQVDQGACGMFQTQALKNMGSRFTRSQDYKSQRQYCQTHMEKSKTTYESIVIGLRVIVRALGDLLEDPSLPRAISTKLHNDALKDAKRHGLASLTFA